MKKTIDDIVKKVLEQENELDKIEEVVYENDMERLLEVTAIAKKGLKFEKIYEERTTYNNHNSWYDDETSFFTNDEGKCMRGIEVAYETIEDNSDSYGGNEKKIQLFLIEDGSYKVFFEAKEYSNFQDDSNHYSREIFKNQNLNQFDFDEIIDNIYHELERRMISLGDRTKTQKARLEKLQELKLAER